jgi:hypothetical protein
MMNHPLFQVGYHKNEIDFAVSGEIFSLSLDQMNQLRAMIVVGIGTLEDMWRREQERNTPAAQALPPLERKD